MPAECPTPALYARNLYGRDIAPDAVQVHTPLEVQAAVDGCPLPPREAVDATLVDEVGELFTEAERHDAGAEQRSVYRVRRDRLLARLALLPRVPAGPC